MNNDRRIELNRVVEAITQMEAVVAEIRRREQAAFENLPCDGLRETRGRPWKGAVHDMDVGLAHFDAAKTSLEKSIGSWS